MASEDVFTTVDVDHERGSAVAVTIDGNDGEILRVEKAAFDPENVKVPNNSNNGMNHY